LKPLAFACAVAAIPGLAAAQAPQDIVTVEALSDLVERGLSATDGRAAARARIGGEVARGLRLDASAATLRGARRNGGADANVDLAASYRLSRGAAAFDAGLVARFYPGAAGGFDYVEAFGGVSTLIGPAEIGLSASYAPDQAAIGGDNLYLRARARAALIGTPISLTGHVGRSSGDADDPAQSARLRPTGNYRDWSIGAEYARGPITLALAYTDTDIRRGHAVLPGAARHSGARLAASIGATF
jgi:uncharacterized protein (TIGR02001 family)